MGKGIIRNLTALAVGIGLLVLVMVPFLTGCSSTTPEAPPVYVLHWGQYGPNDGQFNMLTGAAVDGAGNIYVTDSANNRVQKFSSAGVFLAQWGGYGTADGQMSFPVPIAVDAAGNVYVGDTYNYRIQKFSSTGAFLGKWGSYGTADGQLMGFPTAIAVDAAGNVYVAELGRIQKFSSTGAFLGKWGNSGTGNGEFNQVPGLAVDAAGNVYAADFHNDRIQKFSSTGAFLGKWGSYGTTDGKFKGLYGVAVDAAGNVYVTDVHNNRVQKFNGAGGFLTKWGAPGTSDGEFDGPCGIAVDAARNVYVVDNGNSRVQKFGYPVPGSVVVNATLDGVPWTGAVSFTVTGPQTVAGTAVSQTTAALPPGSYAITYNSGGPPGATFLGGTPAGPQALASGGTATFTLNFKNPTNIVVNATLNGSPWTGPVSYNLSGTTFGFGGIPSSSPVYPGSAVPQTFVNVNATGLGVIMLPGPPVLIGPAGFYNLQYLSGGPPGATLFSVTPGAWQVLISGHTKTFTLNFRTEGFAPDTITVNATLDGAPWAGPVNFNMQGWLHLSMSGVTLSPLYVGSSVPQAFPSMPTGDYATDPVSGASGPGGIYWAAYLSGGPSGATLFDITPPWAVLISGNTKTFTLNFKSKPITTAKVTVKATLDGAPWTGPVSFTLTASGLPTISGTAAAQTYALVPLGTYTLNYLTGGPAGATLVGITSAATQAVVAGGNTIYTLNFQTKLVTADRVTVKATLDGAPWTGALSFTLTASGLPTISGTSVAQTHTAVPVGTYTLAYVTGGPPAATLVGITSAATQTLTVGGIHTYTLNFKSKEVPRGTIIVNATWKQPRGIVPWTGALSFTLTATGLPTISGTSVAHTYTGVPVGTYTLNYVSGGPPGLSPAGITSSATQTLTAGGTVTFTIGF